MRVRQCRVSGRKYPGWVWCVAIGLEPILRFSISIMPALLAMPVDALLYPFNPQAGIELHHNGESTHDSHHVAQPQGRESNPANALSCCADMKKPKALTSGLNFLASERLNGFPALEMNLSSFSAKCNTYFLYIFNNREIYFHLVTFERMESAIDSCLWHSATNSSKRG